MISRVREWTLRLLLVSLSTVFFAAALEIGARIIVWNWSAQPNVVREPFAQFDPDLGWSKPPNARGILRRSEYRTSLEINSLGLRGPEISIEKPPGVRRVLLLGDSFTEGYTVEESDTVRSLLERALNPTPRLPVQVINGGTAGWSTDQEVLFYKLRGRRFSPDLVILLFYYNDLYRDGDLRLQPWFEIDEAGALALRNHPVPPHREFYRGRPFALKPYRGSMALALLQPRLSSHPRVAGELARFGLTDPPTTRSVPDEFHPFGRQRPREVRAHWARLSELLKRLAGEVAQDGALLAVFYVPARFEIDDGAWTLTRRLYRLNAQWDRNRVAEALGSLVLDLGLPFADPRPALRGREGRGEATYFPQDGHWTEAGNEVATAELLRMILRHRLLEQPGLE